MIDWLAASRCGAALGERDWGAAGIGAAIAAAPCFQNAAFDLSPLPLMAAHDDAAAMVPALEAYVALLGRIVAAYREHAEVRDWFGLGPAAEALITADTRLGDEVTVCRLDGYLEQGTERLVLLENNADAPAGTLFSPRINGIVRDGLERAGVPAPGWSPLTFADSGALLATLTAAARRAGISADPLRLAILQFDGRSNAESREMAVAFSQAGAEAFVADPRQLAWDGKAVSFGGRPADVCWNKVNTVAWRDGVERDDALVARWAAALAGGELAHVNPFGARYVAESKLALALVTEPRFGGLFSAADQDLASGLLPWSRRLDGGAVAADGQAPLARHVREHPAEYVIKEPYDIRGDGVTVGRAVSPAAWEQAVARAERDRLLIQRYVPPAAYPVVRAGKRPAVVAMPASFDTFVFGGVAQGFGSKASLNARLNVFQGGQKLAVHVICPESGVAASGPASS
jgi:hypothetical protein